MVKTQTPIPTNEPMLGCARRPLQQVSHSKSCARDGALLLPLVDVLELSVSQSKGERAAFPNEHSKDIKMEPDCTVSLVVIGF